MSLQVDTLVVHHSASSREMTKAGVIDGWHRENGWSQIGYHWIVEGSGFVVRGRMPWVKGAHVKGHNSHSLGICVVGDNTVPSERWVGAQVDALLILIKSICMVYPVDQICGHRDLAGARTECPGLDIGELVNTRALPWAA